MDGSLRSGGFSSGMSGNAYDRWVERQNSNSTISKMQHQYWVTKQAVVRKLGRKEDPCIIASDQELDAKLELLGSIQETCLDLQRIIERYQENLCTLAQEENAMGRFLKEYGKADKTRAGKMMVVVGKTMSYSGQQRLALRVPLVRLYQEVDTFRNRAIEDTFQTVSDMEKTRTKYRGALMWMKNVSQELDPDTYKQLEKFRKVQNYVRKSKAHFDKLKLDCLQKVDLLAASRCNMFSHALILYQTTLMHFWEKTSKTMTSVSNNFKGYQYFEFSIVKELVEPSRKLAEKMSVDEEEDDAEKDKMLFFDADYCDEDSMGEKKEEEKKSKEKKKKLSSNKDPNAKSTHQPKSDSLENLFGPVCNLPAQEANVEHKDSEDMLLDLSLDEKTSNILDTLKNASNSDNNPIANSSLKDLLSDNVDLSDLEKDDLTLLNELLKTPTAPSDSNYNAEWQALMGETDGPEQSFPSENSRLRQNGLFDGQVLSIADGIEQQRGAAFLPSQLLDMSVGMGTLSLQQQKGPSVSPSLLPPEETLPIQQPAGADANAGATASNNSEKWGPGTVPNKEKAKDMSAWFSLFADLDPLANPDAVGKKGGEDDRNC